MTDELIAVPRDTLMRVTGMLGVFEPDNAGITPLINQLLIAMTSSVLTPRVIVTDNPWNEPDEYDELIIIKKPGIPRGPLYSINESPIGPEPPCFHPHVGKLWTGMAYRYTCGTVTCGAEIDPCPACDSHFSRRACDVCYGVRTIKDEAL